MGKIVSITLHGSASPFADAFEIDKWHKEFGWKGIGYNWVILNGFSKGTKAKDYWSSLDGVPSPGRAIDKNAILDSKEIGAHAYGFNSSSIGICMVGKNGIYSPRQFTCLKALYYEHYHQMGITTSQVKGHSELPGVTKTCPDIPMNIFREFLRVNLHGPEEDRLLDILLEPYRNRFKNAEMWP